MYKEFIRLLLIHLLLFWSIGSHLLHFLSVAFVYLSVLVMRYLSCTWVSGKKNHKIQYPPSNLGMIIKVYISLEYEKKYFGALHWRAFVYVIDLLHYSWFIMPGFIHLIITEYQFSQEKIILCYRFYHSHSLNV